MACTPGQQRCIDTLSGAIVVSAGAGSGKTFTLTRRIVNALESGYISDVSELLAITFTSKAAGEIKSRVKGALRAAGMVDQALKVDGAWISTIHGMCSRVLRENALELGIDPDFSILDESESAPLLDAAMEEVFGAGDDLSPAGPYDELFAEFKARSTMPGSSDSVDGMVRRLVERMAVSPRGSESFTLKAEGAPSATRVAVRMAEAMGYAVEAASAQKESAGRDAFVSDSAERLDALEALIASGEVGPRGLFDILKTVPAPPRNFGSAEYKQTAAALAGEYSELMLEARLMQAESAADGLLALAEAVLSAYARRKRALGVLDNNDLLVMAARAFEEHPDITERYASKFKLVMVDEFQDTDQQQVDMIKRFTGEDCERLCTVGDAQQSIYRFRGADVSVYRRHLEHVRAQGDDGVIVLPHNFRSHADVLAFVDRIFEQPSVFGASFMSLQAARDESRIANPFPADMPRIEVQHTTAPYRGVGADELARTAARRIAESFAALREAGHSAGEMVVLLGSMSRSGVYADALRNAGFACVIAGGSVFNRAPEVQMMVNAAASLANPHDTTALFGVLSSDMFVLSADDLLALATKTDPRTGAVRRRALDEGFRSVAARLRDGGEAAPAVEAAVLAVVRAQRVAMREGLAAGLSSLAVDSGYLARLEAEGAEGRACAANILKAIRMAEDVCGDGEMGLARAAKAFALKVALAKEAPGALSARGGDFVRIMTVHSSKGLEFPIVAVAELRDGSQRASKLAMTGLGADTFASLDASRSLDGLKSSSPMVKCAEFMPFGEYDDEQLEAALAAADSRAHRRAAIKELERRGEGQEAFRLLYVALTRAKEALVLSLTGKCSSGNPAGVSGPVCAAVATALFGEPGEIPSGVSAVPFGGSAPAKVERIDLRAESSETPAAGDGIASDGAASGDGLHGGSDCSDPATGADVARLVPIAAVRPYPALFSRGFRPTREGVFSYSAIAHGAVPEAHPEQGHAAAAVALPEDDDGAAWRVIRSCLSDSDKATDLGTAFHRLAQYAVVLRPAEAGTPLVRPDDARIDALCRSCGVSREGRVRLRQALDRWFGSGIARLVESHADVRAEVPFFVDLPSDPALHLEGEIDLLASSGSAGPDASALIVDYKTGGRDDETPEELHAKHLLQARCYAYAVLGQGYGRVEARFVRVERPCGSADASLTEGMYGDAPIGQPQSVCYEFESADRESLAEAILDAYRRSR